MSSRLTLMATSILRLIIGIALIVCGCVFVSLDPTNRQFLLPPGMQKKKSTQHIYIYSTNMSTLISLTDNIFFIIFQEYRYF